MALPITQYPAFKTTLMNEIAQNSNCLGRIFAYAEPTECIKNIRCVSKKWQEASKDPMVVEQQLKNCDVLATPHLCKAFLSIWLSRAQCHKLPLLLTHFFLYSEVARFENRFHFHLGKEWDRIFVEAGFSSLPANCAKFAQYGERMVNTLLASKEKNASLLYWDRDPCLIPFIEKVTVNAVHAYIAELEEQTIPYQQLSDVKTILLKDLHGAQSTMPFFGSDTLAFIFSIFRSDSSGV